MNQQRILIVLSDGSFQGASMEDGALHPTPLDLEALTELIPTLNAAAVTRVAELETELAAAPKPEEIESRDATIARLTEEIETLKNPPVTAGVTKLTIMRRLGDKWPVLKAILAGLPEAVQDAWTLAQEIRSDYPLFVANSDFLKQALGLTDAEFAALLTP
jgi:hypothetical protein